MEHTPQPLHLAEALRAIQVGRANWEWNAHRYWG